MSPTPLLLLGAGGHARACIDVIEQDGRYSIAGLVGLADEVGGWVFGYEVLGRDTELSELLATYPVALVTAGQVKSPELRIRLFEAIETSRREPPCIVSPRAYVSPRARIGAGSIVMHGAVVNADAVVGRNSIINSLALVEHDAEVSDHCHVSTHAVLNSGVRVGAGSFIGSGASVRQQVMIGERCVIGMGQCVISDCEDGARLPRVKSLA